MAESTFNPDAHPESTCCDGGVVANPYDGVTWDAILNDTTHCTKSDGAPADYQPTRGYVQIGAETLAVAPNVWTTLFRGYVMFDTSSIGEENNVLSAYLELCGRDKTDIGSITPDINIYTVTTAANTSLTTTDYNKANFGVAMCDEPISYSNWNAGGWNRFNISKEKLSLISRTGITKIGIRNANYDVAEVEPVYQANPANNSVLSWHTAEAGVPLAPRLVINYGNVSEIKERVLGQIIRIGHKHFSNELILGGIGEKWSPLTISNEPIYTEGVGTPEVEPEEQIGYIMDENGDIHMAKLTLNGIWQIID